MPKAEHADTSSWAHYHKMEKPIKINGAFHTLCRILQFVVASAAVAKFGALFLNCQEGMIFTLALENLDHKQPKNPVCCTYCPITHTVL